MKQKVIWFAFILMAAAQWYAPVSMIARREQVLAAGRVYKFKTAPVDPSDPFRGKYVALNFEAVEYHTEKAGQWKGAEEVFVLLTTDAAGYAAIAGLSATIPAVDEDYVRAVVEYVGEEQTGKVVVRYPFDRFYMEESKAYAAEMAYRESLQDSSKATYALVSIRQGDAVVRDIMIDGVSLQVIAARRNDAE